MRRPAPTPLSGVDAGLRPRQTRASDELPLEDGLAVRRVDDLVEVVVVKLQSHVAVRPVLLLLLLHVRVRPLQDDAAGHRVLRLDPAPDRVLIPFRAESPRVRLVGEVRVAAVADAAPVEAPRRVLVVDHAAVLVPPVPPEELLTLEQLAQLLIELGAGRLLPREGLMVREE